MTALLALLLAAAPAPGADAVRAADLALARAVADRDPAAFAALLDEDARFAGRRGLARGRSAVALAWKPFLSAGGPRLAWAPERAVVATGGDLAFTAGRFTFEGEAAAGQPSRAEGEYVTVWRRSGGGPWRALFDLPLEPAGRLGAGLVPEPGASTVEAGDLEATLGTWARGAERGAYLKVRSRAAGGPWETVVDAAIAFRPEP